MTAPFATLFATPTAAAWVPPIWVVMGLGVAVVEACKDLFAKRAGRELSAISTALTINVFALPPVLFMALRQPFPELDHTFFVALVAAGLIHFVAVTLYMFALQASDLSVTLPMISFTPMFLLLTTPLMLGVWPSVHGSCGVLLIVAGAYLLNVSDRSRGLFAPFAGLVRDTGARAMLAVAFLWSVSANIDPIGIRHSNRSWWLLLLLCFTASLFFVTCPRHERPRILRNGHGWIAGMFNGLSLVLYIEAIMRGPLPYVLSLKRLSILIGMILGAICFGEQRLRERLLGAAVMVAGVVVISTSP